jgi:SAM-dependent methyltransferase
MKRKIVNWSWEDPAAQDSFIKWRGMPDEAETRSEVDSMERLARLQPPLAILDVGCGTGRHAVEFYKRGYDVRGIDVADNYLKIAIQRAQTENLAISFERKRGSELREQAAYDFVYAYFHTLGFMNDDELKLHFYKIFEALKPGGKFLMRTAGPKITPKTSPTKVRNWSEKENEFILSEKYIEDGYRYENCIVINTERQEIVEFREKQKAFSLEAVLALLSGAGFTTIQCFQDLSGAAADAEKFGVYCCLKS